MQIYTNRHLLTRILYGEEVDASFLPCDYVRHFEDGTDAKVTKTSQSVVTTQHPQDMRWSSNNSEGRGGAIPSLGEIRTATSMWVQVRSLLSVNSLNLLSRL